MTIGIGLSIECIEIIYNSNLLSQGRSEQFILGLSLETAYGLRTSDNTFFS